MGLFKKHDSSVDRLMFYSFCGLFFFLPVATSPAVITGFLILFLWVFSGKIIKDRHRWLGQKWVLPVAVLILLTWAGLLYTGDVRTGLKFAKKTHYWLFAFAVASISITAFRVNAFLKAYIAGVSFNSLIFVLQLLEIVPMRPPYSVGLLNKWAHISFSLLLTFSILLLSFYFREATRKRDKIIYFSLMLLNFSALFMLLSDSGHLAFILLSPFIAYNLVRRRQAVKIVVLSAVMVGSLFLSPVWQNRLNELLNHTYDYQEEGIVASSVTRTAMRFYMWTGALKIYLENPVFGVGTGGYRSAMRKYRTDERIPDVIQPHNSFLYMAVSFGTPGVAAFVWLLVILLRNGWRNRSSLLGFSTLAFTLVLITGSLTDTQVLQIRTGMLFSVFTGLQGTLYGK